MSTRFYNTLTRRVEPFEPREAGLVKLYTCGPTVYNYAHLGNFRAYVYEDLLRRYLQFKGWRVIQVMNITDVDDKIIRAVARQGVSLRAFTQPYIDAFFADLETLGIEAAEYYPRATDHIPAMVAMIQQLLAKGLAYQTEDGVYFKIAAFPAYGQLTRLNTTDMRRGERVIADDYEKEHIHDFALWKAWKPEDGDIYWETPLGKGRPGWHIECSAMSTTYLGATFDIHTGGVDNIFPHHENEIAQSEGANGVRFVNYWLHCEHLRIEGAKMSKSLGNFYLLRDLIARGIDPVAIRYTLLATHYRQKLNFTFAQVEASASSIVRLREFAGSLKADQSAPVNLQIAVTTATAACDFEAALDDDLNISAALAALFSLIREINALRHDQPLAASDCRLITDFLRRADRVLNVIYRPQAQVLTPAQKQLIDDRQVARRERNWAEADRIRAVLLAQGIELKDTPEGVRWSRKTTPQG